MCGLAIYNFTIINIPFPLVLYTKLLGDKEASLLSTFMREVFSGFEKADL